MPTASCLSENLIGFWLYVGLQIHPPISLTPGILVILWCFCDIETVLLKLRLEFLWGTILFLEYKEFRHVVVEDESITLVSPLCFVVFNHVFFLPFLFTKLFPQPL